jgi:hypothetical protein
VPDLLVSVNLIYSDLTVEMQLPSSVSSWGRNPLAMKIIRRVFIMLVTQRYSSIATDMKICKAMAGVGRNSWQFGGTTG